MGVDSENMSDNVRTTNPSTRGPFRFASFYSVLFYSTVKDQKYFHNVGISIDLHVVSCLREKLSCVVWSTYLHDFGVI